MCIESNNWLGYKRKKILILSQKIYEQPKMKKKTFMYFSYLKVIDLESFKPPSQVIYAPNSIKQTYHYLSFTHTNNASKLVILLIPIIGSIFSLYSSQFPPFIVFSPSLSSICISLFL